MPHLSETAEAGKHDLARAMQDLAAKGGPSLLHQALQLIGLRLSRRRVKYEEYFTYALWRKDRGQAFRKDFLSNLRLREFNSALKMPARGVDDATMNDKIATEALLLSRGLAVTRTRALFCSDAATAVAGLPDLRTLRSADDIAAYLGDPSHLPVFGKPRASQFAHGAAVIDGLASPGRLRFMNGAEVPAAGLAAEIVQDWPTGYLFQPFYQCESALRRHTGPAMASVRIVTLITDRGVEPWYSVIRLPAKSAMHDGDAFDARIWGLIDTGSGKVVKLRSLRDPMSADLTHGNDPDAEFLGFTMPHWAQAVEICREAHLCFPGNGLIGWDVFLTEDGALLNEANANPGHVYQVAAQRPLLNADMRPAYARAVAFARQYGGGRGAF
jgi:Sugar-transfer associated ATP-grasp